MIRSHLEVEDFAAGERIIFFEVLRAVFRLPRAALWFFETVPAGLDCPVLCEVVSLVTS